MQLPYGSPNERVGRLVEGQGLAGRVGRGRKGAELRVVGTVEVVGPRVHSTAAQGPWRTGSPAPAAAATLASSSCLCFAGYLAQLSPTQASAHAPPACFSRHRIRTSCRLCGATNGACRTCVHDAMLRSCYTAELACARAALSSCVPGAHLSRKSDGKASTLNLAISARSLVPSICGAQPGVLRRHASLSGLAWHARRWPAARPRSQAARRPLAAYLAHLDVFLLDVLR